MRPPTLRNHHRQQDGGGTVSYVKLNEPPQLCIHYPTCSACGIELNTDGDGWTCENCGTLWDMRANDGDTGTLFEDWSGEEIAGPPVTEAQAFTIAYRRDRERQERLLGEIRAQRTEVAP